MKRWGVAIVVAVALVLLALLLRGTGALPVTPEDTVTALFEAATRGDAPAYLRLLTGPLRESIESTRAQLGPGAFADNLRSTTAGIKGIALRRAAAISAERVALDVELVFATRNERQRFVLARQQDGWTIVAIDRAEVRKPTVTYGTPVFDEKGTPTKADAKPPANRKD